MKQKSGYLLIDDRVAGGKLFEADTLTCSHCQRQLIRNPERTRARAYCPKCDKYICDACEALRVTTGVCRPLKSLMEDVLERNYKYG